MLVCEGFYLSRFRGNRSGLQTQKLSFLGIEIDQLGRCFPISVSDSGWRLHGTVSSLLHYPPVHEGSHTCHAP